MGSDLRLFRYVPDVIQFWLPPGTDLCLDEDQLERSNPHNLRPGSRPPEIDWSPAREPDPLLIQQDSK